MVLAVVNQKGGVGKTTTAVSLTAALTQMGRRILLCDFDPQANATSGLGIEKNRSSSVYDVVIKDVPADEQIVKTEYGDLLPSGPDLAGAGVEMVNMEGREFRLRKALEPLKLKYDYILVDCPPSLELLTINALCAADQVLIPVQCEYYALEGLTDLMSTLREIRRACHVNIDIFGIVLTMYDSRTNLSTQVAKEVRAHFPEKVFSTEIPRNVRLSEAPSHGLPITAYDRFSRGAKSYRKLAEEVLKRSGKGKYK